MKNNLKKITAGFLSAMQKFGRVLKFVSKLFNKKFRQNMAGFTLIELLVSIGIFAMAVVLTSTILISTIVKQREIRAAQSVLDDLGFSLESISREVRASRNFSLTSAQIINFTNADNKSITLRLNNNVLERSEDGGASFLPITNPNLRISFLSFILTGQAAGDNLQPRIVMTLEAIAPTGPQKNIILNIQRTLSNRLLDS